MCLAVPGKIISIDNPDPIMRVGKVSFAGAIKEVNLALVPEAIPGNYVIVHAGFALSIVDEEEAEKTLEYLDEIDRLDSSQDEPK